MAVSTRRPPEQPASDLEESPSLDAPEQAPAPGARPVPRKGGEGAVALSRMPALDGLRGLGVAAIIAGHIDFYFGRAPGATHVLERARGGIIGLDVFFVLSGALITTLLLAEHQATGTISLKDFYIRRLRRLGPAFFLALIFAILLTVAALPRGLGPDPVLSVTMLLLLVGNWLKSVQHRALGMLAPMWSLMVEEQFYLTWPTALRALLRRRSRVWGVVILLFLGALLCQAYTYIISKVLSPTDAYYQTPASGVGLFSGCLVGVLVSRLSDSLPARFLRTSFAGLAAFGILGFMAWRIGVQQTSAEQSATSYIFIDILAAIIIGHVFARLGRPSLLTRAMSFAPLVGLGVVSYALYLYHVPMIFAMKVLFPTTPANDVMILVGITTLGAATASYFLVEKPIRRGGRKARARRAEAKRQAQLAQAQAQAQAD